jgi:hypothetical protein
LRALVQARRGLADRCSRRLPNVSRASGKFDVSALGPLPIAILSDHQPTHSRVDQRSIFFATAA